MKRLRAALLLTPFLLPLVAVARAPRLPRADAPIQVPVSTKFLLDGKPYLLSGTLILSTDAPTPTPTPDAVTVVSLSVSPSTVPQGAPSTGTVTLSRAPLVPVDVVVKSLDAGLTLTSPVTIPAGQTTGTFAIGTATVPRADFWYTLSATYGQAKTASLFVRAAGPTPSPPPVPGAVAPVVNGYLNADGTPLAGVAQFGQVLRLQGAGFGTAKGQVFWNGGATTVEAWTDTEIRVRLPEAQLFDVQSVDVRRPDGAFYSGMVVPPGAPGARR